MSKANNIDESGPGKLANLRRMAYFAAVLETGSFTAAAHRLGITKAVVSQQVARLEQEFKTTLLTRTTRSVTATEAGRVFYQRCASILKEAADAFDELGDISTEPSGVLHLAAPHDYGISAVVPAISEFVRRYPQCKVDALLSDQSIDVISGQVELAIRVGWVRQTTVQARQIGTFRQLLVAGAGMRKQISRVKVPQDIVSLPFIANSALRDPSRWDFTHPRLDGQQVVVRPVISLDATLAVREAVRQGAGLSILPDFSVREDLEAGRLVQVLPHWSLPSGGIHALFPSARFRPVKVRAFVELLVAREENQPGMGSI